ncbi:hypothetical protein Tco_0331551 [Tanacetum coccineum]
MESVVCSISSTVLLGRYQVKFASCNFPWKCSDMVDSHMKNREEVEKYVGDIPDLIGEEGNRIVTLIPRRGRISICALPMIRWNQERPLLVLKGIASRRGWLDVVGWLGNKCKEDSSQLARGLVVVPGGTSRKDLPKFRLKNGNVVIKHGNGNTPAGLCGGYAGTNPDSSRYGCTFLS